MQDSVLWNWPDKRKGAVSLTYDGTLPCHREIALRHLDEAGLKGTFFADPVTLLDDLPLWRAAHGAGHEIANGCLMSAARGDGSLPGWTPEMIDDEISSSDGLLHELFPGRRRIAFGYPWGLPRCMEFVDYRELIIARDLVARSGESGINAPVSCSLGYLKAILASDYTAEDLIHVAMDTMLKGEWVVFAFCGIGEAERGIDSSAHRRLVTWLRDQQADIWTDSLSNVALWVEATRARHFRLV